MEDVVLKRMEAEFSLTNASEYANLWDKIREHFWYGRHDKALDCYVEALKLMEKEATAYGEGK